MKISLQNINLKFHNVYKYCISFLIAHTQHLLSKAYLVEEDKERNWHQTQITDLGYFICIYCYSSVMFMNDNIIVWYRCLRWTIFVKVIFALTVCIGVCYICVCAVHAALNGNHWEALLIMANYNAVSIMHICMFLWFDYWIMSENIMDWKSKRHIKTA